MHIAEQATKYPTTFWWAVSSNKRVAIASPSTVHEAWNHAFWYPTTKCHPRRSTKVPGWMVNPASEGITMVCDPRNGLCETSGRPRYLQRRWSGQIVNLSFSSAFLKNPQHERTQAFLTRSHLLMCWFEFIKPAPSALVQIIVLVAAVTWSLDSGAQTSMDTPGNGTMPDYIAF